MFYWHLTYYIVRQILLEFHNIHYFLVTVFSLRLSFPPSLLLSPLYKYILISHLLVLLEPWIIQYLIFKHQIV